MSIIDHHTQDQISDLVEACARYWEIRGIAPEQSRDMQMELEQHLTQAVRDGKSLDVVIGPNPPAFAESWAKEMHPQLWRGGSMVLSALIYGLSVISSSALIQQLLAHTTSFTFTLFAAYLLFGSGLLALLIPLSGFLAPRIRTRQGRLALLLAISILIALIARHVGMRVNWNMALLSWSWPLSLILFALAVLLFSFQRWQIPNQQSSSAFSVPGLRSVMTLVGNIAVFDMLLLLGSLIMVHFCTFACRLL